jgi:ATP-dependent DNA helicase RecQ
MQLATDRQIPPYCICHDSTLRSIARLAPAHLQDLQFVKGMGPRKIGQYGQTLLDAMREDEPVKQTP